MKHFKRTNRYAASNVIFDPETCRAYSFGWWRFVDRIDGIVVFNGHRYSTTTSGHQWKVRRLMRDLGIRISLEIDSHAGLQRDHQEVGNEAILNALVNGKSETIFSICGVFGVEYTQEHCDLAEERLCDEYLDRAFKGAQYRDWTRNLRDQQNVFKGLDTLNKAAIKHLQLVQS